ncbi:MAG: tetratricopeptide repeat protein [Archaeoglobaceae archaeon]|nr:tetratricopeptide repeat protein [Archaeoglobaceae archaeon]MDW8118012.1 tetratricopeptide repeat protein [Archaeoglobaceae archaeon]
MIEDTLREILRNKVIKILEVRLSRDLAVEVEKKLNSEERGRILKEYEKNGKVSEETYNLILSKYCFKDLTSVLFGISSEIRVYPEITESIIGTGKSGIKGLRKHVRELGYSEDKFEEILQAIYSEIRKLTRNPKYLELYATASLEIGVFYLDSDYRKAEEFLLEAYEVRSSLNADKKRTLLATLINLSSLYNRLKKTEKALAIYEKANSIAKELGDSQIGFESINALKELGKKLGK